MSAVSRPVAAARPPAPRVLRRAKAGAGPPATSRRVQPGDEPTLITPRCYEEIDAPEVGRASRVPGTLEVAVSRS
jgi:hypothetical protein